MLTWIQTGGRPISSRIKNYAFRLTAIALSLLCVAGVLEICLRIFGPPYYRFNNLSQEYYTNPRGYHDALRKEGKHTVYGLKYRETPDGYRTPFVLGHSPDTTPEKFVLGVGDSYTYGRGVRYQDICYTRLERLLNQGQTAVAVRNCSVVGAHIWDIAEIYDRESPSIPPGSLVIYGLVLNDFGLVFSEPIKGYNFIDFNNEGYSFSPLRNRSALINFASHSIEKRRLHTMTVKAYLESFEGRNAENGFGFLKSLYQSVVEDGGTLMVVVFPLLYDFEKYRFSSIHEKIDGFCRGHGILHLDLFPAFSRHAAEELWANPTDHHPNELAHRIAADEIAAVIENELPDFAP